MVDASFPVPLIALLPSVEINKHRTDEFIHLKNRVSRQVRCRDLEFNDLGRARSSPTAHRCIDDETSIVRWLEVRLGWWGER
jgi:hypothetical protein